MSLKYYQSSIPIQTSASDGFKQNLQAMIDSKFDCSSDVYTIQEELVSGSKIYTDISVRINHVINSSTGVKLGDDFRGLIFQDISHPYGLGYMYQFDNNYWLTTFSDTYHYPTASATIRRCNNVLRWYDENHNLIQEPCFIDYKMSRDRFDYNDIVLPDGDIIICTQGNINTKTIQINKRFIFNGQVFKCRAINNYLLQNTFNNDSAPLIYLTCFKDNIASDDDLINGIANTNQYNYSLTIDQNGFSQLVNYTNTLTSTLKLNNTIVTAPLIWSSSDSTKATIDANTGVFHLLDVGSVTFSVAMVDNPLVTDNISINIVNVITPVKTNTISPMKTDLLQNTEQIYTVNSYTNGAVNTDDFLITVSGIPNPSTYYTLIVIDGNSFKIKNLKLYSANKLHVLCTNNIDMTTVSLDVQLKGLF